MASREEIKRAPDDDEDRLRGREQLQNEDSGRENRIRMRREQKMKQDAAKRLAKRNRMFKVAGAWVGLLIVGFFVVAWFSPSLINWLVQR